MSRQIRHDGLLRRLRRRGRSRFLAQLELLLQAQDLAPLPHQRRQAGNQSEQRTGCERAEHDDDQRRFPYLIEIKAQRDRIIKAPATDAVIGKVRRLLRFKGIGAKTAWLLTMELFGWRTFANRRELGSLTGLTPTPYNSGETNRDQGISKVGNRRVRGLAVEIAWGSGDRSPMATGLFASKKLVNTTGGACASSRARSGSNASRPCSVLISSSPPRVIQPPWLYSARGSPSDVS